MTMSQMPGDYEYKVLREGFSVQKQWHRNRLLLIKTLRFLKKMDVVLDAGCGPGNAVLEFAPHVKKIEGWDNNRGCVDFLSRQIKKEKLKNASASYNDLLKVKGKPKFSKIILTEVIEHFTDKDYKKMLMNLSSLLVSGGEIFITTPNDLSMWPFLEFTLNHIQTIPKLEDRHLARFTKGKLEQVVKDAGYTVRKSGSLNFLSPFLFFTSEKTRDAVHMWESRNVPFGALLYVIASKK